MNNYKIIIIAETPHYIVLHKPHDLLVERSPYFPSLEQWVASYLAQREPRKVPFVGIVHRIDRAVSGVVLVAKKKSYLVAFNEQFRLRQVTKTYHALVEQPPPEPKGTLHHFLTENKKEKKAEISAKLVAHAKACSLSYQVLKTTSPSIMLEIALHTGKFHQIRAQLAYIGCPIIGDEKYGARPTRSIAHIALQAHRLEVTEPNSGERLVFQTPDTLRLEDF